jgi:hypothetical protein
MEKFLNKFKNLPPKADAPMAQKSKIYNLLWALIAA